jgi:DNA-binding response OmpR family regulator
MAREKILAVDYDLDSLSRIYLALIHRKYKAEACNNPEEISARLKRFKPAVVILTLNEYKLHYKKLKIPAIVLVEKENAGVIHLNDGDIQLKKPVYTDELIKFVERLV